jgi:hypothetical protein
MCTFKYKEVKIRKPQYCHGCSRKFEPGTKIVYSVGVNYGDFWAIYNCKACDTLMQKADYYDYWDGFPEGWVNELLGKGQTPEDLLK